jgi:hypothetical protein
MTASPWNDLATALRAASDPAAPPEILAIIASLHPQLIPVILANPATTPSLRDALNQGAVPDAGAQPPANVPWQTSPAPDFAPPPPVAEPWQPGPNVPLDAQWQPGPAAGYPAPEPWAAQSYPGAQPPAKKSRRGLLVIAIVAVVAVVAAAVLLIVKPFSDDEAPTADRSAKASASASAPADPTEEPAEPPSQDPGEPPSEDSPEPPDEPSGDGATLSLSALAYGVFTQIDPTAVGIYSIDGDLPSIEEIDTNGICVFPGVSLDHLGAFLDDSGKDSVQELADDDWQSDFGDGKPVSVTSMGISLNNGLNGSIWFFPPDRASSDVVSSCLEQEDEEIPRPVRVFLLPLDALPSDLPSNLVPVTFYTGE